MTAAIETAAMKLDFGGKLGGTQERAQWAKGGCERGARNSQISILSMAEETQVASGEQGLDGGDLV